MTSPWRRLAAFGVDYFVIATYLVALTAISILGGSAFGLSIGLPRTEADRLRGELLGFATLTLPVLLYFAVSEGRGQHASLGKRVLGLRVTRTNGLQLGLGRSLVRSSAKFAPWELAHAGVWHTIGPLWPQQAEMGPLSYLAPVGMLLALVYLGFVLVPPGRTPYDRIADARVVTL